MLGIKVKNANFWPTFRPSKGITAHFPIELDSSRYRIKTATTREEIQQALRLRYKVFFRELLSYRSPTGIDTDRYDRQCDHLLIIDKASNQVVGTYRLRVSTVVDEFYSQSEFDLGSFLDLPGVKLELGRACIDPEFRNGIVMRLLWRGIQTYARLAQAQWLFGCSSLNSMDGGEIQAAIESLAALGAINTSLGVSPIGEYHPREHGMNLWLPRDLPISESAREDASERLPPLLLGYVRSGAKVLGLPAVDASMKCVDFFTVLDLRGYQREI